jgi:hypothetical protein
MASFCSFPSPRVNVEVPADGGSSHDNAKRTTPDNLSDKMVIIIALVEFLTTRTTS